MAMTDPVADMLTRIRNAGRAGHKRVDIPVSKFKTEIARLLRDNHFIQDFNVLDDGRHGRLRLFLKERQAPTSFSTPSQKAYRIRAVAATTPNTRNAQTNGWLALKVRMNSVNESYIRKRRY